MQRIDTDYESVIAQLAAYKMNVKPNPNIASKLKEKLTAANKSGSASEVATLKAQLDEEQKKLAAFEASRNKFKEMLFAFFKSLPSDNPEKAFKQLHLCSLTLFMQCTDLDSVIPYTDLSFNQQRCQLLEDALKEYCEGQIKNAASNENYKPSHELCRFWIDIYACVADAKDIPIAKGIDGALSTFDYAYTQKSKSGLYFTSNLHDRFEKIRTKQTAKMISYTTKDQEDVKATPPSCSLFSQVYERDIKAELDTHKGVFECLDTLMNNIKSSLIDEKMLTAIIEKLKSIDKSTINWEKYAKDNLPDLIAEIQKKLTGDQATVEKTATAIVVNCVEALRAVAIEKLDKNQIDKNGGIIESLRIIHQNKQKLMAGINAKKESMNEMVQQYQMTANVELHQTKLNQPDKFNDDYSKQKTALDEICKTSDPKERRAKLAKFAEEHAGILTKRHKAGSTSGYIESYFIMLNEETNALLQQAKAQGSPEWSTRAATAQRSESLNIVMGNKARSSESPEVVREVIGKPFNTRDKFDKRKAMMLSKGPQDAPSSAPNSPNLSAPTQNSSPISVPSGGTRTQPESPKAGSAPGNLETGGVTDKSMLASPSALMQSSLFKRKKEAVDAGNPELSTDESIEQKEGVQQSRKGT